MPEVKKLRVAINGFGRIGRITFRFLLNKENVEVVAVNDLTDINTLAHLLKYDSVHGKIHGDVFAEEGMLRTGNHRIKVFSERNPELLPWKELNVDLVIESTGLFLTKELAGKHLSAGAKRVLLSAPAKDLVDTVVLGVNDTLMNKPPAIISNASCTTNCVAPMIKIIDDAFGIQEGFISTIHAYTGDQNLIDAPHKDLRRARAAALSIIPTTTGAAKAVEQVLPHLHGKLQSLAFRVPVPAGSLIDMSVRVNKHTSADQINSLFRRAAQNEYLGIVEYTEDPIVSSDIIGNTHSCIFDAELTHVMGDTVKVIGWYDNETGYSCRIADLVTMIAGMN